MKKARTTRTTAPSTPSPATPEMLAITEETAMHIEELAGELMDAPITFGKLMKVRLLLLKHSVENGYCEALAKAIPFETFQFSWQVATVEELGKKLRQRMAPQVELGLKTIDEYDASYEQQGFSQEELLQTPQAGLNETAMEAYRKGGLTIRRLFEIQPEAVVGDPASSFTVS